MLRVISLAAFCSMASMRVCDPMLVSLAREFSVTTGDASAVIAAFAVSYGVLQLFYGPLGDRLGKVRVVIGATFACALFSGVTALAPTLPVLVAARAAMGASAAGIIPLSMAWIGDNVPYEQRQETLAQLMVATVSGMMAGQWFGGFAVEALGWRARRIIRYVARPSEDGEAVTLTLSRLAPREIAEVERILRDVPGVRSLSRP